METPAHSELIFSLSKYTFGETVATVIRTLFAHDQASLRLLKTVLPQIKLGSLKRALLILVKYQLVDYVRTTKNQIQQYEYSVAVNRVFLFFRIPKFIEASRVADTISYTSQVVMHQEGVLTRETLISRTYQALQRDGHEDSKKYTNTEIKEALEAQIFRQFFVESGKDFLCLNIERLGRHYRDTMIIRTIGEFYNGDAKVTAIARTIIDLSLPNTGSDFTITNGVDLKSLQDRLCPRTFTDKLSLEKYIMRLSSEETYRFIVPCGARDDRGPMFAINMGLVVDHLMKEHICSVIASKLGPKCCRVFRVLLMRGPLLLKQIEECIMLPARDVREYSYMLIKEGYIRNRQVPKTPDHAPGKSVFIMSVDIDQVVFKIADLCCRSMSNLISRHEFELQRNEAVLNKAKAVSELLGEEELTAPLLNLKDLSRHFNSHQLSQLIIANRNLDKILLAQLQVDETLFVAHVWLSLRPKMEAEV